MSADERSVRRRGGIMGDKEGKRNGKGERKRETKGEMGGVEKERKMK